MHICEECGAEFEKALDMDSKRFCCKHHRRVWIGKHSTRKRITAGTFVPGWHYSKKAKSEDIRSPYGTWKCSHCGFIGETRAKLKEHQHKEHPEFAVEGGWNKGLTIKTNPIIAKSTKTLREGYASGRLKGPWCGKKHTEETKRKLRFSTILRNVRTGKWGVPTYNLKGCEYMDKLNESKGWHLQHGMNGGEVFVEGYWLDGYDKDLNIAFEYDEPRHYLDCANNVLRKRDIERMNYIHEKLGCRFFRYNEKMDYLYEVSFP